MHTVIRIDWLEYERGWGSRPDGYTLYPDIETAEAHVESFLSERTSGPVPDEYSNPGEPKQFSVGEDIFVRINESPTGYIWCR